VASGLSGSPRPGPAAGSRTEPGAPAPPAAPPDRPGLGWGRATALAAALTVAVGLYGTMHMRGWGRVPFTTPSAPWYHSWPFYLFWRPRLELGWAALAVPLVVLVAAGVVALARLPRPRPARLAAGVGSAAALALAVAGLAGGTAAWREPLAAGGEYPAAVRGVGSVVAFLDTFDQRVPSLPDFAAQHPPFATLFYVLAERLWPGLTGAAVLTVLAGSLGLLVVAGLAADELGEAGERWATACWCLAPAVVLYLATSADAMWAPVLAGGLLAAHRGLARRSWAWTAAGGALLWLASMLTFAAVLVLPFLLVRALARWQQERAWVLRWAAATIAVVVALAALLAATAGYDVLATVAAVNRFWSAAPGTSRAYLPWTYGNLLAFTAVLGAPLAAGLVAGVWGALRRRAWGSFEVATLASLLAGALWGHTKGEVERMWQFLVPLAVVVAVRRLRAWRAPLPAVAALLLAQALLVQVLFFTRW
jgi:methylthioxylose transferase